MKDTETLDKLYLEWSQFTSARTRREIDALALLEWLDRRGGLGFDTHSRIKSVVTDLSN